MQRRHPVIPCVLAVALIAAGCGKEKSEAASATSPGVPNADIKSSLGAVPAEAGIVVSVSSPSSLWDLATGKDFIPMDPAIAKEFDMVLKKHIDEHIGLDFTELRSAVVYAGGEPFTGAIVLTPVRGTLRMGQDVEGGKMIDVDTEEGIIAAHRGDTLIVGQRTAALLGLAALAGQNAGMSSAFKKLVESQAKDAYVSASADVSMLPIPPNPITGGLRYGGFRFAGGKIAVNLEGDNETLKGLSEQLDAVLTLATLSMKTAMDESQGDLLEGTVAILSYYSAKNMSQLLKPEIKGETMNIELDMGFGGAMSMMFVSVAGILAAVAIPAFIKYIKKSKTAEATQLLRKLNDAARMAQMEGTLPATSVGPTPPVGSCCGGPEDDKCEPIAELWQDPTWQALHFDIADSHYFSYEFVRIGEGYEVRAYGDLDCDGVYSTYSMASGDDSYVQRMDELE